MSPLRPRPSPLSPRSQPVAQVGTSLPLNGSCGSHRDREALCKLWRAIILRDDVDMQMYSKQLGVKGEQSLKEKAGLGSGMGRWAGLLVQEEVRATSCTSSNAYNHLHPVCILGPVIKLTPLLCTSKAS